MRLIGPLHCLCCGAKERTRGNVGGFLCRCQTTERCHVCGHCTDHHYKCDAEFDRGRTEPTIDHHQETLMTKEELAQTLTNLPYPLQVPPHLLTLARETGLVIVYGESDDRLKLAGAIEQDINALFGTTIFFDQDGLLVNECEADEQCPYYIHVTEKAVALDAHWWSELTADTGYLGLKGKVSWTYSTTIPHATFDIMSGDDVYCRGLVFALADIAIALPKQPAPSTWIPAATLPLTGEPIIIAIFTPITKKVRIGLGFYAHRAIFVASYEDNDDMIEYHSATGDYYLRPGWYEETATDIIPCPEVTHWLPFPPVPHTTEQGASQ